MNQAIGSAVAVGALVLLCACSPAHAQEARPTYPLQAPRSLEDGAITRYISKGSPIPLHKRYAELSAAERAVLKQNWQPMPEDDEPPFPLRGLRPVHEGMARVQRHLLVEGDVSLIASVNALGEVTEVKAVGGPSRDLINAAASVLFDTKFKPAVCGGQPCAMQYPFYFRFVVD